MSRSACRSCVPRSTTAPRSTWPVPARPTPAASRKRSSLPSSSHRPRKRFGQHFLHDPRVLARIVDAIAPSPTDCVVEIGPGEGALTRPLLERAGKLEVIEVDRDLAARLRETPGVTVHEGDALEFDFGAF